MRTRGVKTKSARLFISPLSCSSGGPQVCPLELVLHEDLKGKHSNLYSTSRTCGQEGTI